MKYRIISCASILALGCLSACAPLQGNQALNQDLARVQNKVAALEQRTAGLEKDSGVKEILRRQAEQQAELDSTRIDLQSINGRIADQEDALKQLREEIKLRQSDLELRLAELEDQLNHLSEGKTSTQAQLDQIPGPLPSTAGDQESGTTGAEAAATTPLQVENKDRSSSSAEELYREALQLVQQDMQFREAREKFTTFVEKYPQHKLAVNAMYWIGETLYGNKKYENAILQFQDVIQMYPEHSKVPAALLKQGLAFYGLGDPRNAKIILQKVVDKYPDSPEAKKAQERLEEW
ncbi:MAG: tol-pal system protein YbgF [Desulfuromonadaceae bacterium]